MNFVAQRVVCPDRYWIWVLLPQTCSVPRFHQFHPATGRATEPPLPGQDRVREHRGGPTAAGHGFRSLCHKEHPWAARCTVGFSGSEKLLMILNGYFMVFSCQCIFMYFHAFSCIFIITLILIAAKGGNPLGGVLDFSAGPLNQTWQWQWCHDNPHWSKALNISRSLLL